MTFNELIDTIMPLVNEYSDIPCVVWKKDGGWNIDYLNIPKENAGEYLEKVKANDDPYAIAFTGQDFSRASFPMTYDKVLAARLWAEYKATSYGAVTMNELNALANFFEDYASALSSEVCDYLATLDRPLFELNEMKPFSIHSEGSDFGYDEEKVDELIELIENHMEQLDADAAVSKSTESANIIQNKTVYENDTVRILTTGRNYDFVAAIENKTDQDILLTLPNTDDFPFDTPYEIPKNDWVGLLNCEYMGNIKQALETGDFETQVKPLENAGELNAPADPDASEIIRIDNGVYNVKTTELACLAIHMICGENHLSGAARELGELHNDYLYYNGPARVVPLYELSRTNRAVVDFIGDKMNAVLNTLRFNFPDYAKEQGFEPPEPYISELPEDEPEYGDDD